MKKLLLASMVWTVVAGVVQAQQEPLRIYHLSARPVLHEDGRLWDARVRFVTSAPAVTVLDYGDSRECRNQALPTVYWDVRTDEALRNHRFDLTDLPRGRSIFLRVRARTDDGREAASEVIEVAAPADFPAGTAQREVIPLTVTETEGVARAEPVTFGIPLPQGLLGRAGQVALTDAGQPVPAHARALVRWPDGTIKWLLVTARVSIGAGQTKTMELALGAQVRPNPGEGESMITDAGERWLVDTGAATFEIDKRTGVGALTVGGVRVATTPRCVLTTLEGWKLDGRVESVKIEEDTAQRAVILVSGHHVTDAGERSFGYELRYFCHAGDPYVRLDHVLKHDIVSADMKYGDEMKSFAALDLVWDADTGGPIQVATDQGLTEMPLGQRLFQHSDAAFTLGEVTGTRAPGLLRAGRLMVAVRDFWQNWPKDLAVRPGAVSVGLYPAIEPADRYAQQPDEWMWTYYLRDGHYTFRAGLQKRHELLMGPSDVLSAEQMLARVNAPLLVSAPPRWYCDSGALHGIASSKPGESALWDEIMAQGIDDYFATQDANRWYGLMNFGDCPGGRSYSWANIEYDRQHGLFTQYFRTGDRRFFVAGEQCARHNADVDIVHHAAGQVAGPGGPRRVGQAWVHCMGHTGGYYPHNYLNMDLYASGYCENEGHMWAQGNWEYWLLTGDEQVRRAAQQLADWACGPDTVNFDYGNARVPGWMGIIAMSSYFATEDEYYLNGMRLMYETVQKMGDEKYGLWIHQLGGGHCDCDPPHYGEAGFMAGVLMTALKYLYLATGDDEVAQRIVKIAHFIVDTMWVPETGEFRYTSCPKTAKGALLMTLMANGMAFAANYADDDHLRAIVREGLARAILAVEGGGAGRQIAYGLPIASMPMALYEVGRFPGPSLAPYLEALRSVGASPAARPVPALVPNPDFEQTGDGWRTRPELSYEIQGEVVHTGRAAARAAGLIENQGEYLVTWYDCGPPWEIQSLVPGQRYRAQLWLRVDRVGAGVPAPTPRVAFRSHNRTRSSVDLSAYDMSRVGQWQLLEGEFTVPEGTESIYIAVSTKTAVRQEDVLMYLDDIAIVPASAPRREVYVYAVGSAQGAALSGALALAQDELNRTWQTITSPEGRSGAASFTITTPLADQYRVVLCAKSPEQPSQLRVAVDGRDVGQVQLEGSLGYQWLALEGLVELGAGAHELTVTWPAGCKAVVHKVCLTNESE